MARECLELGFYLSVAGPVTYKKADQLREVAREMPLERLLIETDAPYLAPQPYRGKRNEPAYVVETARCLAESGHPVDELERLTADNARRLFGIDGDLTAESFALLRHFCPPSGFIYRTQSNRTRLVTKYS